MNILFGVAVKLPYFLLLWVCLAYIVKPLLQKADRGDSYPKVRNGSLVVAALVIVVTSFNTYGPRVSITSSERPYTPEVQVVEEQESIFESKDRSKIFSEELKEAL